MFFIDLKMFRADLKACLFRSHTKEEKQIKKANNEKDTGCHQIKDIIRECKDREK